MLSVKQKGRSYKWYRFCPKYIEKIRWEKRTAWKNILPVQWKPTGNSGHDLGCPELLFQGRQKWSIPRKSQAPRLIAADQWRNSLLWLAWQSTFFSKQMPCFCSLLSGVPALYRLLQGKVGHRCSISFNLWKWYHMCVSLFFFFWLVIQMFNLNMSHLIFLLLSSLPSTCAHTAWTDCPLGSYVGIDQVGQPCHWGVSKCACAWVSVQHSWSTFVYLL